MNDAFWRGTAMAGEVRYPPGGAFGPRYQATFQLVFIHAGHASVWIDGHKHFAETNTAFLLFPDHEEHFVFTEEQETWHTWLNMPVQNVDTTFAARLHQLSWSQPLSPTMHQLIREALTIQQAAFPTARELLLSLGLQMLWRYLGEGELLAQHTTRHVNPAVEQAQQFIAAHLEETLTLNSIAQAVAISPAHLIRLFQSQLQTTPMAYLWQQRVARGIELLEQTGMSVGQIAERCGFQSRFHFSRRVHAALGYSPLAVRQRSWQHTAQPTRTAPDINRYDAPSS